MSAAATTSPTTPRRGIEWNAALIDSIALAFLIVAMCSQITLHKVGQDTYVKHGYVTKQLTVALADTALNVVFVWCVIRTTLMKAWKRVWWPPLACWALIFAVILATLHSQPILTAISVSAEQGHGLKNLIKHAVTKESKEALAKSFQFITFFILAPWTFVNLIHDRRSGVLLVRRRLALISFSVATLLATLIAAAQVFSSHGKAPTALFGSPNIYAAFLAMALPLICARFLQEWRQLHVAVVYMALALVLSLFTIVSIWALAALFIGIIVAGWLMVTPTRLALVLAGMTLISFVIWTVPTTLKPNRDEFLRVNSPTSSQDVKKQYIEWYAALSWSNPQVPVARPDKPGAHSDDDENEQAGPPPEHLQAFATGVGPGNYQLNIGPFYGSLPNEEKMPPDSNNLYLVQAVSLGLLGLGSIVWVLLHFARQAVIARRRFQYDWLSAGVLGSLAAFAFVNLFHAMLVRGTGIVLAFVFSLTIVALQREDLELDTTL
jgi:hypothetical protein